MTINTSLVVSWQKALIVCSSPLDIKQWVYALASDINVGHDFNLPLSCPVYAYSVCHQGSAPGAVGIQEGKVYDAGWNNTPVWIIAFGSK